MASYIGNQIPSGEFKKLDNISASFNDSDTTFDLEFNGTNVTVGDATQLQVSINGVVQEPQVSYTLANGGKQIAFTSAPPSGASCFIVLFGGIGGTTTPSDNSVTPEKLTFEVYTKAETDSQIVALSPPTDLSDYSTTTEMNTAISTATSDLANKADKSNVLELNNTTAYSPTSNYHPATKAYVDALASSGGGNVSITQGFTFTGDGTTTTFDCGADDSYILGAIDVYHNGLQLDGSDYTAADGRNITLTSLTPASGDIVKLVAYGGADVYNKTQTDTLLAGKADLGNALANGITYSTSDPTSADNVSSVGHIWVNTSAGYAWVCIDNTTNDVSWRNVGNGTEDINIPEYLSATGGTVTTDGDYKVHTFTSSGTFQVTAGGNASGSNTIELLIVAGGAGGGGSDNGNGAGGGGGAGGLLHSSAYSIGVGSYGVTIGAGGSGNNAGSNSSFVGNTAIGGGYPGAAGGNGLDGGSGGSGGGGFGRSNPGGSGTSGQGFAGGNGSGGGGGGGGGSAAVGNAASGTAGGNGGAGASYSITGLSLNYAGGGGGGGQFNTPGTGGAGGGGAGGNAAQGTAGSANTGGGGGGAGTTASGIVPGPTGGSGIVIVRYKFQN